MTSHPLRRTLTVFVLLASLALAAVPAQATPFGPLQPTAEGGFFLNLWELIASLFEKAGMTIDPNGKPEEAGMTIDPDGDNPDPTDEGMSIDPNG